MHRELRPDVTVMDIAMPLLNGREATIQILKTFPETRILMLSAHSDPIYVEQVVKAGASGYLVKQSSGDVLAEAIRAVHQGKTFFTPSIARLREKDRDPGASPADQSPHLSHLRYQRREKRGVLSPAETLENNGGSCRDFATLFMEVCRFMGLAARFVSGNMYSTEIDGRLSMHGWAEVYLPGAGWIGFDPS